MNVLGRAFGFIAEHDQRGRFVRSLRYAPERAHLQFFDLIGAVDLALKADFASHFAGALGEHGRSHTVGRFVDQVAGEVLRFGDDAAGINCGLQSLGIGLGHDREGIDFLVFTVALVVVRLEIADDGAFDDGANGVGIGDGSFGQGESEAAQVFRFKRADGRARQLAEFGGGESLCLAAAEQQQAFRFQSSRPMQKRSLEGLARHFAAGDDILRGVAHNGIGSGHGRSRLVFPVLAFLALIISVLFLVRLVEHDHDKAVGFDLGRR